MITVKDVLKNTTPGTPYKFISKETGLDVTQEIALNPSYWNDREVSKMSMIDNKIHYFVYKYDWR